MSACLKTHNQCEYGGFCRKNDKIRQNEAKTDPNGCKVVVSIPVLALKEDESQDTNNWGNIGIHCEIDVTNTQQLHQNQVLLSSTYSIHGEIDVVEFIRNWSTHRHIHSLISAILANRREANSLPTNHHQVNNN